tara:strand:+ start:3962 stop:4396 length:435 start_codon:yes stop_codon:yes gene_type:complete
MNSTKYKKLYLQENWGENKFIMIQERVNVHRCFPCPYSINFQISHPKVLSGEAFWITHDELCIGYLFTSNRDIFRPVFSYKRQRLLDKVHGKKNKKGYGINNPHLGYARKKYMVAFNEYIICANKKKIPMDCVNIILSFIHQYL